MAKALDFLLILIVDGEPTSHNETGSRGGAVMSQEGITSSAKYLEQNQAISHSVM